MRITLTEERVEIDRSNGSLIYSYSVEAILLAKILLFFDKTLIRDRTQEGEKE